jgi:hypothetical protein
VGSDRTKTAAINKMKVTCSSIGIPQAEPILKEYFMSKDWAVGFLKFRKQPLALSSGKFMGKILASRNNY